MKRRIFLEILKSIFNEDFKKFIDTLVRALEILGKLDKQEKDILEGKRKTAKNMLRLGLTVEQVVDAAELSIEEVVQLKKEIEN